METQGRKVSRDRRYAKAVRLFYGDQLSHAREGFLTVYEVHEVYVKQRAARFSHEQRLRRKLIMLAYSRDHARRPPCLEVVEG